MLPVVTMTSVGHYGTESSGTYPLMQDIQIKTCHVELNLLMLVT